MNNIFKNINAAGLFTVSILCLLIISACAPIASQLPTSSEVRQTDTLPIDGVWRISTNNKRIRISNGRAYALDSWLHMGIIEIKLDEVVIQNLIEANKSIYQGYDLPLQGGWLAHLKENGALDVTVNTQSAAIKYHLNAVWLDDKEAFDQAVKAL